MVDETLAVIVSPSEKHVREMHPAAEVVQDGFSYYILDRATGKALSPYCTGEAPAWRWAEIHISYFGKLGI